MVALFYLPVTSPLVCASHDATLLSAWATGRAKPLMDRAEESARAEHDPVRAAFCLQTCADMCLLHGRHEDADRFYRRSMCRLVEPGDIDTFSCRAAGYHSLFHHRPEHAAGCFQRLSLQGARVEVRLEAMLMLSLLFHQASLFAEAHADLNRLADLATAEGRAPWLDLAHTVGRHYAMLARIHASTELDGHVEWRVATEPSDAIQRLARLPARVDGLASDDHVATLLARREAHVRRLDLLSDPSQSESCLGPRIVRTWGHDEPALTRPQAFVEMTMAALSTRRVALAALLLAPVLAEHPVPRLLQVAEAPGRTPRRAQRLRARTKRGFATASALPAAAAWPPLKFPPTPHVGPRAPIHDRDRVWNDAPVVDLEAATRPLILKPLEQDYVYAVSRLRVQQGRDDEGARHYRSYLVRALAGLGKLGTALRRSVETQMKPATTARLAPQPSTPAAAPLPSDDVTRRLPGRYLVAYHYMLEHLSRADLTTREMAMRAKLSERSLQMAFSRYLGESPRDLLKRRRMERIHAELQLHPHSHASIMEVAMRHGVTNRAALVAGFRKHYAQTPTASLAEAIGQARPGGTNEGPSPGTKARQASGPASTHPVVSKADVAGAR